MSDRRKVDPVGMIGTLQRDAMRTVLHILDKDVQLLDRAYGLPDTLHAGAVSGEVDELHRDIRRLRDELRTWRTKYRAAVAVPPPETPSDG